MLKKDSDELESPFETKRFFCVMPIKVFNLIKESGHLTDCDNWTVRIILKQLAEEGYFLESGSSKAGRGG
jgi:hypothetical protein